MRSKSRSGKNNSGRVTCHVHSYLDNQVHGFRVLEKAVRKFSSCASSWAKRVMARDQMICQDCGTIEGELHAHHIVPVSVAPHLVSDVDNGVTLCAPCHRKRHGAKAGKKAIRSMRKAA